SMQEISPAILDFCMQGDRAALLLAALCQRQTLLVSAIEGRHFDLAAIGERREVLQAKVDGDRRSGLCHHFRHFYLNIEIPAPPCVLCEAGRLDLCIGADQAKEPQPIFAAKNNNRTARLVNTQGTWRVERNP